MAFEQAGTGVTEFVQLHTTLYNPFPLWQFGKVDELIRGSAAQNPRPIHTSFAAEVIGFPHLSSTYFNPLFVYRWPTIYSNRKMPVSDSIYSLSTSSAVGITVFHLITNGAKCVTYHPLPISVRWKNSSGHIPSS